MEKTTGNQADKLYVAWEEIEKLIREKLDIANHLGNSIDASRYRADAGTLMSLKIVAKPLERSS